MTQGTEGFSREAVQAQLSEIESSGLYRRRVVHSGPQSVSVTVAGNELLNFCSNDYLGLANDPRLAEAMCEAIQQYGVGSGASPLVCGYSEAHEQLENQVASLCKRDRALVFSSGYLANLAVSATLAPGRDDCIYQDRLNHASIIDAAKLGNARLCRYSHSDIDGLRQMIAEPVRGKKLVVTDAVFSMDGDIARLADIAEISREAGACLVVDDAHGLGVLGRDGGGTLEELGLDQDAVPLMVATFGKAVGCSGAFVAGREDLVELLLQQARPYIYSTAMPPALAKTACRGIELVKNEAWRREKLRQLATSLDQALPRNGVLEGGCSPAIRPVIVGDASRALELSQALREEGILVTAIRPPTVPANTARLRVTLSAAHEPKDLQQLLDVLGPAMVA